MLSQVSAVAFGHNPSSLTPEILHRGDRRIRGAVQMRVRLGLVSAIAELPRFNVPYPSLTQSLTHSSSIKSIFAASSFHSHNSILCFPIVHLRTFHTRDLCLARLLHTHFQTGCSAMTVQWRPVISRMCSRPGNTHSAYKLPRLPHNSSAKTSQFWTDLHGPEVLQIGAMCDGGDGQTAIRVCVR
jgi:hypothetical protein